MSVVPEWRLARLLFCDKRAYQYSARPEAPRNEFTKVDGEIDFHE